MTPMARILALQRLEELQAARATVTAQLQVVGGLVGTSHDLAAKTVMKCQIDLQELQEDIERIEADLARDAAKPRLLMYPLPDECETVRENGRLIEVSSTAFDDPPPRSNWLAIAATCSIFVVVAALGAVMLYREQTRHSDCAARGGQLVQLQQGPACVRVVPL